jgi:hypothetical protein
MAIALLAFTGRAGAAAVPAATGPAPTGPAKERRLHVASAEASSYLVNDWNKFQENYLPLYVGDDDPKTAWSLKTEGIGEWLRVHTTQMEGATRLRMKIRNGYQKSPKLFEANSRAKELTVTLLPSKKTVDVTLTDAQGWQDIAVDQPAGPLEAVELKVKSVYAGKKYDDLCISDVQLFATATSSDNPAFEKQRLTKIVAWKKERVAAAKLFQTKLGQSLPIAPQYVATPRPMKDHYPETKVCTDSDEICYMAFAIGRAREVAGKRKPAASLRVAYDLTVAKFAGMAAVRVSVRDKRPLPPVDGLCTPSLDSCIEDACDGHLPLPITNQIGYLDANALALVEQTGLPSFDDAMARKLPQCNRAEAATFAWALREPPASGSAVEAGRLRALLIVICGMVEGREGSFPTARSQLLVYGADGKLEVLAATNNATTLDWKNGDDGPKLAGGFVTGAGEDGDLKVEAVTLVANN